MKINSTLTIAGIAVLAVVLIAIVTFSTGTLKRVPADVATPQLVTEEQVAASQEYVVDASDMLDGAALVSSAHAASLSSKEAAGLIQMREEEKLAHDVYDALGEKWHTNVFANIARSEQTHTDAVKVLLDRYGIADPANGRPAGSFKSPEMQALYEKLVAQGTVSQQQAFVVGATVEDLDIHDLDVLKGETVAEDILTTYDNLQKGSRNHMRAFIRNVTASGSTYAPQFISAAAFEAIVTGPQERGLLR